MTKSARKTVLGLLVLGALAFWPWTAPAAPLIVSTGKVEAAAGKEVQVPISVKGVKDVKGLSAMSIRLTYDPTLLSFKAVEKGPRLPNALFDKSVDEKADPGKVALGFVCGSKTPGGKEMASVEEDGVVLKVVFVVNDKATIGQQSPLKLDNYRAVDSAEPPFELQVKAEDGAFTVKGPGLPWLWILIGGGVVLLLVLIFLLSRRRGDAQPRPSAGAPAPFASVAAGGGLRCPKCQALVAKPGQRFCAQCGATMPRVCTCGQPIREGASFCAACGQKVAP